MAKRYNDMKIDIYNLTAYQEDHRIEAKTAKNQIPNNIWETYSSFANTEGGIILLGVVEENDHSLSVRGVEDSHKLIGDFWNIVNNRQKVSVNILTNNMVYDQEIEGKQIVVIEVPRADRTIRPVYIGQDPMRGTYVRYGEGDHLCNRDQVAAIYRDAAASTTDTKVLKGLDMSVFDMNTVHDYRNYFNGKHAGHVWSKQDDELFLRSIGAMGFDREDGRVYPTVAGLLMFGHEYDITREMPDYFLDYREQLDPKIRWTHRIVSSSGDWSGNLFDFFFHVYHRLRSAFPVPFQLSQDGSREDDVPMHKALREMMVNTLAHSDYYGQKGVVIVRRPDSLSFANPGDMRPGLKTALSGGTSDARNATIMKMFGLLDFGERAGSGIPDLFDICNSELDTQPDYDVTYAPARTTLTIDTSKMTHTERTIKADEKVIMDDNDKADDKRTIKADDKRTIIIEYIHRNGEVKTEDLVKLLSSSTTRIKMLLYQLVDEGILVSCGGNRNRTYKLKEREQS